MGTAALIIGIAMFVAGFVAVIIGPRRTITTVVNKVEHDYKKSTDYGRLYDLLMEGRRVIIFDGSYYPSLADIWQYNGNIEFHGFKLGRCDELKNCTKEKFVLYCKLYNVSYLDQIDKYLTMMDYKKKD